MTKNNLNIILGNALCCSANKAIEISDLLSMGNKCVNEKIKNLQILNDSIESLKCYKFDTIVPITNSVFTLSLNNNNNSNFAITVIPSGYPNLSILMNGVTYSIAYDGIKTSYQLFINLLTSLGVFVSVSSTTIGNITVYTYTLNCNIISLNISFYGEAGIINFILMLITPGNCNIKIVPPINCLTSTQMDFLAHKIMSICDICDCQLIK